MTASDGKVLGDVGNEAGVSSSMSLSMSLVGLEALREPAVIALDTPVWLATVFGMTRGITPALLPVLEQAAQELRLVVSAASTLQVARLAEDGHLPIRNFRIWLDDMQRVPGVRVEPLTSQLIGDASALPSGRMV